MYIAFQTYHQYRSSKHSLCPCSFQRGWVLLHSLPGAGSRTNDGRGPCEATWSWFLGWGQSSQTNHLEKKNPIFIWAQDTRKSFEKWTQKIKNNHLKAQNNHLEAQNNHLEAQNKYMEAQNKYMEAQNKYLEAQNKYLEAQNKYLEALHNHTEKRNKHWNEKR